MKLSYRLLVTLIVLDLIWIGMTAIYFFRHS